MTGKTHLAGGFAAGAALSWVGTQFGAVADLLPMTMSIGGVTLPALAPGIAVAMVASLLPDIDEPQSLIANSPTALKKELGKGRKGLDRHTRRSAGMLLTVAQWITTGLAMIIRVLAGGHRGATHMLLITAALGVGAYFLGDAIGFPSLWLWFSAGYLSHLVLDMLTPSGLELLWPLWRRNLRLLPRPLTITTGTAGDVVARVLLVGLGVWLLLR
jgi:membrane-bound metal-dependent hydrolase YbcI (DUF457 family)